MPNIQVQFRRGTTTQHSSFTGAAGEVTVDTDLDTLRVHDGSTAGGVRLAKHSEIPTGGGGTVTSVDSGTGLTGGPITTSGTLSIAAGGVGTTQIADNGVTFAKMQDINTAKVIGRTTAGSGDPEEVSILDEDAMTSNSATALATQQSIKAYVDSQVSAGLTFSGSTAVSGVNITTTRALVDLSSVIGSNRSFVLLHVLGTTGCVSRNFFITPGDLTLDIGSTSSTWGSGASGGWIQDGKSCLIVTTTDTSGRVAAQSIAGSTTAAVSFIVLCYQNI